MQMSYSHILIVVGEQSLVPFIGTLLADKYDVSNDIALKTETLLLLDLRMPGMNMLTLLAWAQDTYPNAPIALTVSDELHITLPDIAQCVEAMFVPKTKG
jgi:CheY-like chemotaxis protein